MTTGSNRLRHFVVGRANDRCGLNRRPSVVYDYDGYSATMPVSETSIVKQSLHGAYGRSPQLSSEATRGRRPCALADAKSLNIETP